MIAKKWMTKLAIIILFVSGLFLILTYGQNQASSQLYRALQDRLTETWQEKSLPTTDMGTLPSAIQPANSHTDSPNTIQTTTQQPTTQKETTQRATTEQTTLSPEDKTTRSIHQLLNELHADNADIIGWIRIPGTNIDYPVVLGDDNRYYLDRNINRTQSRNGSIFMDYRNHAILDQKNTILYGHHTRDHTMFTDLMNYKKQLFFKENALIEYYTLERKTVWLIFSAYVTDTKFYYIQTIFPTDESFDPFLEKIKNRSKYFRPTDLTPQDQILTLSTCTYEFDDARFVVHAVLLDSGSGENP
ncbi:MAG: class B sortase [Bacillota bacterium]|nr:class B sortase [Bacillota bacterium]